MSPAEYSKFKPVSFSLEDDGPLWTLDEAIKLVRELEEVVKPVGYHCALGGSVLMRGESKKDLDIFVYPHQAPHDRESDLIVALGGYGLQAKRVVEFYADEKRVIFTKLNGKRIDLFLVS